MARDDIQLRFGSRAAIILFLGLYASIAAKKECKKVDNIRCSEYKDNPKVYCAQSWVIENCEEMCYLCRQSNATILKLRATKVGKKQLATPNGEQECKTIDHSRCARYKDRLDYYCIQPWSKKYCGATCGLCKPRKVTTSAPVPQAPLQECTKVDNSHCLNYKDNLKFYCKQEWMENNCEQLCGRCKPGSMTATPAPPAKPQATIKPDCSVPDHPRCHDYKEGTEFYCKQRWCKTNCNYMCGVCTSRK